MQLLTAKPIARAQQEQLLADARAFRAAGTQPLLKVALVGSDAGSRWYAQAMAKLGARLGITVDVHRLDDDCRTDQLIDKLDSWNRDASVHGILVDLPLPRQVDKAAALAIIDPAKDVDCVCPTNRGRLFSGDEDELLLPATPQACIELVASIEPDLSGLATVVVGRGDTVGRPLAAMLLARNATVTICHTRTRQLAEVTRTADVLFAAAGRPGLINAEMVAATAIVVDAGVNEVDDRMVGDVDADSVAEVVRALTPVPGGVGALTTTFLLGNVLHALQYQRTAAVNGC